MKTLTFVCCCKFLDLFAKYWVFLLPVEHGLYKRVFKISSTILILPTLNRNQAKFDLLCFQSLDNRFGGAEGVAPFKACFSAIFAPLITFKNLLEKNPRICSTGLEAGCKPILFIPELGSENLRTMIYIIQSYILLAPDEFLTSCGTMISDGLKVSNNIEIESNVFFSP